MGETSTTGSVRITADRSFPSHVPLVVSFCLPSSVIHECLLFIEYSTLSHLMSSLSLFSASSLSLSGLSILTSSSSKSRDPSSPRFRIFLAYHGFCLTERTTYTSICIESMGNWYASDRIWSRLATRPRSQLYIASLESSPRQGRRQSNTRVDEAVSLIITFSLTSTMSSYSTPKANQYKPSSQRRTRICTECSKDQLRASTR